MLLHVFLLGGVTRSSGMHDMEGWGDVMPGYTNPKAVCKPISRTGIDYADQNLTVVDAGA